MIIKFLSTGSGCSVHVAFAHYLSSTTSDVPVALKEKIDVTIELAQHYSA